MAETINIDREMLAQLGVEFSDLLGPGIELDQLLLSTDGRVDLSLIGLEGASHPEIAELKARQLLTRIGEKLGDDWDPIRFKINSTTLNGRELEPPGED